MPATMRARADLTGIAGRGDQAPANAAVTAGAEPGCPARLSPLSAATRGITTRDRPHNIHITRPAGVRAGCVVVAPGSDGAPGGRTGGFRLSSRLVVLRRCQGMAVCVRWVQVF